MSFCEGKPLFLSHQAHFQKIFILVLPLSLCCEEPIDPKNYQVRTRIIITLASASSSCRTPDPAQASSNAVSYPGDQGSLRHVAVGSIA